MSLFIWWARTKRWELASTDGRHAPRRSLVARAWLDRQDRECAIVDGHTRSGQWEVIVWIDGDEGGGEGQGAGGGAGSSGSAGSGTVTVGDDLAEDERFEKFQFHAGLETMKIEPPADGARPTGWSTGWWIPESLKGRKGKIAFLARLLRKATYNSSGYRIFPVEYLNNPNQFLLGHLWSGFCLADGYVSRRQTAHLPHSTRIAHSRASSLLIPSGIRQER